MPPFNKELVMKTLKTYVLVPLDSTSISNGEKSPFYDARQLQFIRNLPKDTGGDPSLKDFAASAGFWFVQDSQLVSIPPIIIPFTNLSPFQFQSGWQKSEVYSLFDDRSAQ